VKSGDPVAIKLLRRCDGCNGTAGDRLRREAQLIARLRHAHIVEVFEYGDLPDGRKYIVMELLEGTSLKRALEPGRPVPWRRAQAMLVQIADALAYAHENAVVHRDLSPANILLTPRDDDSVHCTVIDFGLARSIDGATTKELTNTGDLVGTPRYMSPEQAKGDVATPASDIYALGCIAYELLTGRPAAPGETLTEVVTMQQFHVPPPFAEVAPGLEVPPALEAAVHRALRKRPVQRFADMAAFRDALGMPVEDPAPWSSRWMSFALRRLFVLLALLSVSTMMIASIRW
jgi:serine/threonine protein kinase